MNAQPETDAERARGIAAHKASELLERKVDAALVAIGEYVLERNELRRERSIELFGHAGAFIPEYAVDGREQMRRAIEAAEAVR